MTPRLVFAVLIGGLGFSQTQTDVAVSFDRVVRPSPSRKDSDSGLLWLRLRNNSHAPIQVLASAAEAGADGVEVVHEIVGVSAKSAAGWISPPEHYSPSGEATSVEIQPNSDLLFSVPLNHVGPSWRLQITFEFVRPKPGSERQPEGTVDFTWADVPVKDRGAWKK